MASWIFPNSKKSYFPMENIFKIWPFFPVLIFLPGEWTLAADQSVLTPRVPVNQIEEARTWTNPYPSIPKNIAKGKHIFHGKAFCVTCHGFDGKGLGNIPGLRGKLPRNFTDQTWQAARTDGELFWILQNGSPGTDMASFIPLVLTEEEAWYVILYVRSFAGGINPKKE